MSQTDDRKEEGVEPAGAAGDTAGSMRLRAETPRVTRISRKVLMGAGMVVGIGIGGALIYALPRKHSLGAFSTPSMRRQKSRPPSRR